METLLQRELRDGFPRSDDARLPQHSHWHSPRIILECNTAVVPAKSRAPRCRAVCISLNQGISDSTLENYCIHTNIRSAFSKTFGTSNLISRSNLEHWLLHHSQLRILCPSRALTAFDLARRSFIKQADRLPLTMSAASNASDVSVGKGDSLSGSPHDDAASSEASIGISASDEFEPAADSLLDQDFAMTEEIANERLALKLLGEEVEKDEDEKKSHKYITDLLQSEEYAKAAALDYSAKSAETSDTWAKTSKKGKKTQKDVIEECEALARQHGADLGKEADARAEKVIKYTFHLFGAALKDLGHNIDEEKQLDMMEKMAGHDQARASSSAVIAQSVKAIKNLKSTKPGPGAVTMMNHMGIQSEANTGDNDDAQAPRRATEDDVAAELNEGPRAKKARTKT